MKVLKERFLDARKRYKIRREKPQLWRFADAGFGYIQIPKVATRSIRQALVKVAERTDESFADFELAHSAHVDPRDIRKLVNEGLFVFVFVRDPLARLHLAWVNKIVDGEREGRKNIFRCHNIPYGTDFKTFVRLVSGLADRDVDRHLRSQAWFLADDNGVMPQYVGKLEQFSEHWQALREKLPVLSDVDHINKAAFSMNYLSAYDDETLELAVGRFRRDFELFDYPVPVNVSGSMG